MQSVAVPQRGHQWRFREVREVRKILSDSLENEIVENVNGTYDPNRTYVEATPAKVREVLLGIDPGPHAAERGQLVAVRQPQTSVRGYVLPTLYQHLQRGVPTGAAEVASVSSAKIAICHACLAIFVCIVRKEYVPPVVQVITEEGDIDEGALQRAQEAAHAEVKAAADTETVAEPEEHDMSDNITRC